MVSVSYTMRRTARPSRRGSTELALTAVPDKVRSTGSVRCGRTAHRLQAPTRSLLPAARPASRAGRGAGRRTPQDTLRTLRGAPVAGDRMRSPGCQPRTSSVAPRGNAAWSHGSSRVTIPSNADTGTDTGRSCHPGQCTGSPACTCIAAPRRAASWRRATSARRASNAVPRRTKRPPSGNASSPACFVPMVNRISALRSLRAQPFAGRARAAPARPPPAPRPTSRRSSPARAAMSPAPPRANANASTSRSTSARQAAARSPTASIASKKSGCTRSIAGSRSSRTRTRWCRRS